jgi:hypothetical protein
MVSGRHLLTPTAYFGLIATPEKTVTQVAIVDAIIVAALMTVRGSVSVLSISH